MNEPRVKADIDDVRIDRAGMILIIGHPVGEKRRQIIVALSRPQVKILKALAKAECGLPRAALRAVFFDMTPEQAARRRALTHSQQVSLSRSLLRLLWQHLVYPVGTDGMALSDNGQYVLEEIAWSTSRDLRGRQQITCPYCHQTERQVKAGLNQSGSQRYRCQRSRRRYTPKPHTYGEDIRQQAIHMYQQAGQDRAKRQSLRKIARQLGVNRQTVANWVKAHTRRSP
jgi:transposase-like protein